MQAAEIRLLIRHSRLGNDPLGHGATAPGEGVIRMQVNLSCPLHMPIAVCAYARFRFGKWEHVRAHCRGLPSR